jgi:hypothetical protein
VALAHFADAEGFCFPSQETLALMTSQGISTVRDHLKSLASDGVLRREHRYKKNKGRTSDGFFLNAPKERLQPIPPKSGGSALIHSAEIQHSIPPKSGGDLLKKELLDKTLAAHAALMAFLAEREGSIPDGAAQGSAIKWLLKTGYGVEQCKACFNFLSEQEWRTSRVSWLTVKGQIGAWVAGRLNRRLPTQAEMNAGGRGKLVL